MTIFIDPPRTPTNATFAGGIGSLADIAGAARDSLLYVENAYASSAALQRVLDERRKAIHAATGAQLADPMAAAHEEFRQKAAERSIAPFSDRWSHDDRPETLDEIYDRHLTGFRGELAALAGKFPDAAGIIGADRNPWDDAAELARKSDERLGTLMASRSGLGKYGALLAGGMAGALADPITVMSLAAGGGPGAARTVAGRILTIAGKEAVINAATEAAIQPSVQAWRARAGLDHGMDEAIRNVLFAGAIGGAFGGGLGAAGEALSRAMRPADTDRAAEALAADPRLSDAARSILANDGLRAADALAEIRPALRAEQRGALDAAETVRLADEARPPAARADRHDVVLAEADRVARMPDHAEAWPGFRPDPAQIGRVVRAIADEDAAGMAARPDTPLIDFLIARGGVADFKGELRAIGAAEISERFRGRLVKDKGESLDYAREAAAQAGFFDHLYGDAETAANRSTVADLLDVLEEEVRTRTGGAATSAEEAALGTLEGIVADIARMAGPAVDDAVIERAARMAVADGTEPFDALERVLIAEDAPPAARPHRTGEPMPGWSDAELLAASERRGAWPEAEGIDEPGRLTPDDTDFEGELARQASAGPFGPVATAESFGGDWAAIVSHLSRQADGEVTGALTHPETGAIDVPWGFFDPDTGQGAGLAKIVAKHAEVVEDLPEIVAGMTVASRTDNRIRLASEAHKAVIRLDYDGQEKTWLMTAFEIGRRTGETTDRPGGRQADGHSSSASPADTNIGRAADDGNLDAEAEALLARAADDLDGLPDDVMIPTDDGMVSVAALRDEIAARDNAIRLVEACKA